jgi:hypothetical protein
MRQLTELCEDDSMHKVVPELFFAPYPDDTKKIACWKALVVPGHSDPIAFISVESERSKEYAPGDEGYDGLLMAYREEYQDGSDSGQYGT